MKKFLTIKSLVYIIASLGFVSLSAITVIYVRENNRLNNKITKLEKQLEESKNSKNEPIEQKEVEDEMSEQTTVDTKKEEAKKETPKKEQQPSQEATKSEVPKQEEIKKEETKEEQKQEVNPLIGTWRYTNGNDVTTYVFKSDGTLWINDEYVDKYTNNSAICDNCLVHKGLHEIQFMIKDGLLYINFYKETKMEDYDHDGIEETPVVYYLITMGSYVKEQKIA